MLETSKDVLYIVLALSIGFVSFFVAWAIFYVVMILRDFQKITFSFRKKLDLIDEILYSLKEKLDSTSSYVKLITDTIASIFEFKKARKKAGKRKTKSKK